MSQLSSRKQGDLTGKGHNFDPPPTLHALRKDWGGFVPSVKYPGPSVKSLIKTRTRTPAFLPCRAVGRISRK